MTSHFTLLCLKKDLEPVDFLIPRGGRATLCQAQCPGTAFLDTGPQRLITCHASPPLPRPETSFYAFYQADSFLCYKTHSLGITSSEKHLLIAPVLGKMPLILVSSL